MNIELLEKALETFPEKIAARYYFNSRYNLYCTLGHLAKVADITDEDLKSLNYKTSKEENIRKLKTIKESYGFSDTVLQAIIKYNDSHSSTERTEKRAKRMKSFLEALISVYKGKQSHES